MKKNLFFLLTILIVAIVACDKSVNLPAYTPPVSKNFSVGSLKHTQDTVSVGDTIYLTATGTIYNTAKSIYAYLNITLSNAGVSTAYNYGSAAAPVTLTPVIGEKNTSGLYAWTSTITLPGATSVPSGTKLTVSANFIYQLSLSSEQGTLAATDAGVANKTILVQ
jgi:hypothetical protein